jgi:hypothetical protein
MKKRRKTSHETVVLNTGLSIYPLYNRIDSILKQEIPEVEVGSICFVVNCGTFLTVNRKKLCVMNNSIHNNIARKAECFYRALRSGLEKQREKDFGNAESGYWR